MRKFLFHFLIFKNYLKEIYKIDNFNYKNDIFYINFINFYKMIHLFRTKFSFASLPRWATVDPFTLNASKPHTIKNILDGKAY